MRKRVIFVGARLDTGLSPAFPKPLPYRYSVQDALPWIRRHEYMAPGHTPAFALANVPAYTVSQNGNFSKKLSQFTLVESRTDLSQHAYGREWDRLQPGEQSEKYFQLTKPALNKPCGSITSCVRSAGPVHPTEKRRFSIAELKRICAFPDDFILTGPFKQQWERLGRAVPPLMMRAVAEAIRDRMLCPTQ